MSERPEWMPSEFDLDQTSYQIGVTDHDSGTVALCRMVYDTGLRAQAAKLEEMIEGQTGHWVDRIKAEIERLRKEIG